MLTNGLTSQYSIGQPIHGAITHSNPITLIGCGRYSNHKKHPGPKLTTQNATRVRIYQAMEAWVLQD